MLKRQSEGIAKAKAEGKYKGRKSVALDLQQEVVRLVTTGMSKVKVANELKIGKATVYRILRSTNQKQ